MLVNQYNSDKKVVFDKGPWVLTGWQLLFGGMFMLIMSLVLKEHYTLSSLNHWGWIWFFWLIIPASVGSFGLWFYSLSQRGQLRVVSYFSTTIFDTIFNYRIKRALHVSFNFRRFMRCCGINVNSSSTEEKYFIKYNIQYIEYKYIY